MKFDAVISDITKLVGLKLNSIKPGANIYINSVDLVNERIFLTDASNNKKSRPFEELRRIWECLCTDDVAHVDTVLAGSGSSRNQPETILANLSYIEWLIISNKKHLRYVGKDTHPIGTLKQMDSVAVHQLKEGLRSANLAIASSIVITNNIKNYCTWIEILTGVSPTFIASGVYRIEQAGTETWITSVAEIGGILKIGNYPVLNVPNAPLAAKEIIIAGKKFYFITRDEGVYILYTR